MSFGPQCANDYTLSSTIDLWGAPADGSARERVRAGRADAPGRCGPGANRGYGCGREASGARTFRLRVIGFGAAFINGRGGDICDGFLRKVRKNALYVVGFLIADVAIGFYVGWE